MTFGEIQCGRRKVSVDPLEKSKLEPRVIICPLVMVVGKLKRYRCLSKGCARRFGNKTRAALSCSIEQGARLVSRVRVECTSLSLSRKRVYSLTAHACVSFGGLDIADRR